MSYERSGTAVNIDHNTAVNFPIFRTHNTLTSSRFLLWSSSDLSPTFGRSGGFYTSPPRNGLSSIFLTLSRLEPRFLVRKLLMSGPAPSNVYIRFLRSTPSCGGRQWNANRTPSSSGGSWIDDDANHLNKILDSFVALPPAPAKQGHSQQVQQTNINLLRYMYERFNPSCAGGVIPSVANESVAGRGTKNLHIKAKEIHLIYTCNKLSGPKRTAGVSPNTHTYTLHAYMHRKIEICPVRRER